MKSKEELRTEYDIAFKVLIDNIEREKTFEWFYSKLMEGVRFNNAQFKRRFSHLKRALNETDTLKDRIKFLEGKKLKKPFDRLKDVIKKQQEEIRRLNKLIPKK